MFLLWVFFGRDEKPVATVEVRPPEGLDPVEMEYVLSGSSSITEKSVYSMVILWASRGFVEIIKTEHLHVAKFIRALPDTAPEHENKLFEMIFGESREVVLERMPDNVQNRWDDIGDVLNKEIGDVETDGSACAYLVGLCIVPIFTGVMSFIVMHEMSDILRLVISLAICLCFALGLLILNMEGLRLKATRDNFGLVLGLCFVIPPLVTMLILINSFGWGTIVGVAFAVSYILCSTLFIFIDKRKNTKLYGRILGFRNYLTTVEKHRLRELTETDYNYALELLPYMVLFNMGVGWTKKFERTSNLYNEYIDEDYLEELDSIIEESGLDIYH